MRKKITHFALLILNKRVNLIGFFLLLSFPSFAADPSFGGTSNQRHEQMKKNLHSERKHKTWCENPYCTGDWGGVRSKLARQGLTIGLGYMSNGIAAIRGGRKRGFAHGGVLSMDLNMDIGKRTPLKGLSFYTSMRLWKIGSGLGAYKIGTQYPIQQVFGRGTIRLNECYFKQEMFEKLFVFKVGRLSAGNDFIQSNLYYQFMNGGFDGNPIAALLNGPFTSYPLVAWGCFAQFRPSALSILGKIGAYVADRRRVSHHHWGQNWSFRGSDGVQLITEWAYELGKNKRHPRYPGSYRCGCFYYTKSVGEKYLGGQYVGNRGCYFLIDQMVYQPEGAGTTRGLTPFIALLFAPKDRNLFPFFLTTGLVYKGLFPSRPKDFTNLGWAYGRYSRDRSRAQMIGKRAHQEGSLRTQSQDFEAVLECNHWFRMSPWLAFSPDFQYIIHPKGLRAVKNAWVLGIQMKMLL